MRSFSVVAVLGCVVGLAGCGHVAGKDIDAGIDALPPGSATLTLADAKRWVPVQGSASISFTIVRGATVTGPLTVKVTGLPTGVTAADVAVDAGATNGALNVAAATGATVGAATDLDVALFNGSTMLDHKPLNVLVAGLAGSLDTTYGTAGKAIIQLPDPNLAGEFGNGYPRAFVQYPAAGAYADKLLVAVQLVTKGTDSDARKIAVVRLNANGSIDTTFNTNGYTLIGTPNSTRWFPAGIALDSQGRIVVALRNFVGSGGTCNNYVARLTSTGVVDTTFTVYNANPPGGFCGNTIDVKTIAGDKIVLVGTWNNPGTAHSAGPLLVQLNSDGTPDTTAFNGSEAVRLPNPDSTRQMLNTNRMYVDAQGRYILLGSKCDGTYDSNTFSNCVSTVGRVTPAGAWDTTYNTTGYNSLTFGSAATTNYQGFNGGSFDSSGKLVTAGATDNYTNATLARWNSDGSIDSAFGTSGRVTVTLATGSTIQELDDVALDSAGRAVSFGYAVNGGSLVAATRYSTAGQLDTNYATGGVATQTSGGLQPIGTLQSDDRALVIGCTPRVGMTSVCDMTVWRFWP